jgi:hypothetical protein
MTKQGDRAPEHIAASVVATCPCGGRLGVVATDYGKTHIKRRRVCKSCGAKLNTYEMTEAHADRLFSDSVQLNELRGSL